MSFESLDWYRREAHRTALLSAAEEVALAQRIERGDREALHVLVEANLRLVLKVARRYRYCASRVPQADLVQAGNLGLFRAAQKYDWRRGLRFSTYAVWHIRQAVQRAVLTTQAMGGIGVRQGWEQGRILQAQDTLSERLGREPSEAELAAEVGCSVARVADLVAASRTPVALDAAVTDGGETWHEWVADEQAVDPCAALVAAEERTRCEAWLARLPEREARLLRLRFGFDGEGGRSLREAGAALGLSGERARQLEQGALRRLRQMARGDAMV